MDGENNGNPEIPIKIDDLGVSLFLETPIWQPYPPGKLTNSNGKSPFLIGDTSSNGCFSSQSHGSFRGYYIE